MTLYENILCYCYCPESMECTRSLFSVCSVFSMWSHSWSWWEWRERPVVTDADGTPAGRFWLRPGLWCKQGISAHHDDGLGWSHTPGKSKPGIYYVPGTRCLVPDPCDISTYATYHLLYHTLESVSLLSTRYVLGPFLSSNFFSKFSSCFFQEKQEKQEKQEAFPKFGNLREGKMFGRLRILIFGNKNWKIWIARKKYPWI